MELQRPRYIRIYNTHMHMFAQPDYSRRQGCAMQNRKNRRYYKTGGLKKIMLAPKCIIFPFKDLKRCLFCIKYTEFVLFLKGRCAFVKKGSSFLEMSESQGPRISKEYSDITETYSTRRKFVLIFQVQCHCTIFRMINAIFHTGRFHFSSAPRWLFSRESINNQLMFIYLFHSYTDTRR